jgi:lipoprotein-anchoring transpeptidase ErfK/SrfK
VKRAALGVLLALGLACAGVLSASVVAGTRPLALLATVTSGSGTTATTTSSTSTATTTTTTPSQWIAAGVTIAGVPVGTLTVDQASEAVAERFAVPLVLVVAGKHVAADPAHLGATAAVASAVARALKAAPGTEVKLVVRVNRRTLNRYVLALAKRFDTKPVDSVLSLRRLRPFLSKDVPGHVLGRLRAAAAIQRTLVASRRGALRLFVRLIPAKVTRQSFGSIIVIRRASNRLYLYDGMRLRRVFGVATGQAIYPTPLGRFAVVVKWRNPWWYPPASPWARGAQPIPPGPGNPLGTRWMGLSAPGVGIHGTPDSASIGYSASHGCIRMRIPEAEWLFAHVRIGTPVFIVAP